MIFQYDESAIKLMKNRKESSGKCTYHFDIRSFYATNLISHCDVTIEYYLTNKMIADCMLFLILVGYIITELGKRSIVAQTIKSAQL